MPKKHLKPQRDPEQAEPQYTHRNHTYLVTETDRRQRSWYGQWWGADGTMREYGEVWGPRPLDQFLRSVNNTIDVLITQGKLINRDSK